MTQMLFYEIIILYYKYYSMMWESLVSIKPLVMTSSKILISLFCLSYVIRCIILNVTIHLYQFFSSMSRALFVLFSYIILHRNWLIGCSQGFGGRKVFFVEKVLMKGRSLICLKRTSDMCMCCYLSKKFVVIWNDCLFLLNDVLKLFSITYRFKTLLK